MGVSALSSHAQGKNKEKKSSNHLFHVYFFNQVVASWNKKKVIHQLVVLVLQYIAWSSRCQFQKLKSDGF